MSRKHNTKHNRGISRYPSRLRKRGETSASVRMRSLKQLRGKQDSDPETTTADA